MLERDYQRGLISRIEDRLPGCLILKNDPNHNQGIPDLIIIFGSKWPRNKATFNAYVNDAIGYGLDPEVVLYHSENAFGTADAIGFDEKKRLLRIHDLKTGVTRVNMLQLHIYAALFCLEYEKLPGEIDFETRIYQNDDILVDKPQPDDIAHIMDKITWFDKLIEEIKSEDA